MSLNASAAQFLEIIVEYKDTRLKPVAMLAHKAN